jgi:Tfp pilus assembly protein PilV
MRCVANLWRSLAYREEGQSFVELGVAMTVLSIAVLGVIGTMGLGMTLTGGSRQRSSASAVATERIERARNLSCSGSGATVCYSHVATYEQPTYNADTSNPDNNVSNASTPGVPAVCNAAPWCYKTGTSTWEPLVVDPVNGGLKHIDDPITVGTTQFSVYQYVTSVTDPVAGANAYKRVTVVVTWKYPVSTGTPHTLAQSTFVSNGTIALPGVTPTPVASATPTPSPSPSPTPTPTPGACPGDTAGPAPGSISALSGAGAQSGFTNSTSVSVQLQATDPCAPLTGWLSNTNNDFPSGWTDVATLTTGFPATVTWTIPSCAAASCPNTIYAQFKDGAGNLSTVYSATIMLDTVAPSPAPGSFSGSASKSSGSNCNFTLSWTSSSDANLVGYRVYKQINGGTFSALNTTTALSYIDTASKTQAYAYKVRAYDKAGNESGDSIVKSFAKNSC